MSNERQVYAAQLAAALLANPACGLTHDDAITEGFRLADLLIGNQLTLHVTPKKTGRRTFRRTGGQEWSCDFDGTNARWENSSSSYHDLESIQMCGFKEVTE